MITIYILLTIFLSAGLISYTTSNKMYGFSQSNTNPIRGALILLVVFHHIFREFPIRYITCETEYFGKFAVAGFFFMSGYGSMYSLLKKGNSYMDNFLEKKFRRILPLVMSLTCIILMFRYYFGGISEIQSVFHSSLTILPNSWFIWMLLLEYAAFFVVFRCCAERPLIGGGILLLINIMVHLLLNYCGVLSFWYARIYAVNLGVFVAIYEGKFNKLLSNHAFLLSALCIILLWLWCIHPTSRIMLLVDATIPLVLYIICYFNDFDKPNKQNDACSNHAMVRNRTFKHDFSICWVLRILGKYSLHIYLIHGIILYLLTSLVSR